MSATAASPLQSEAPTPAPTPRDPSTPPFRHAPSPASPSTSSAPAAHPSISATTDFLSDHGMAFATSFDPVLRHFLDPTLTLQDVATRTGQPVLAIVQYFQRPFVQDIIKLVLDTIKARAHMLADAGLHSVVKVQYLAIEECERLTREQPISAETPPTQLAARARIREQARKAANTLLRLRATRNAQPVSPGSRAARTSPPVPSSTPATTTKPTPAAHTLSPDLPQTIPRAA